MSPASFKAIILFSELKCFLHNNLQGGSDQFEKNIETYNVSKHYVSQQKLNKYVPHLVKPKTFER